MTARYSSSDNTLKEISQMEKPTMPVGAVHLSTAYAYERALAEYNTYIASLRTLPCSPECVGRFIHDCDYEAGKDYEIKTAGDWKWCTQLKGNVFAAPVVPVKSEDEELKDYIDTILSAYIHQEGRDLAVESLLISLKQKFTITRKQ